MDMQNSSQTWCMLLNRKSRTLSLWVWVTRHPFYLLRPYLRIYFAFISTENEFEFLLVSNITNVMITYVQMSTSHIKIKIQNKVTHTQKLIGTFIAQLDLIKAIHHSLGTLTNTNFVWHSILNIAITYFTVTMIVYLKFLWMLFKYWVQGTVTRRYLRAKTCIKRWPYLSHWNNLSEWVSSKCFF
jgi:hypothetical protein